MSEGERRRWVVVGTNEQTGAMSSITIETTSAERAMSAARKNGILPVSAEPEIDVKASQSVAYASSDVTPSAVGIHFVSAGAAFKAGFYGGLGAMAAWVVVWIVVGFVLFLLGLTFSKLFNW